MAICSSLGGHSYLIPVASGRWQESREISRGTRKLAQTPRLSKKMKKTLLSIGSLPQAIPSYCEP